PPLPAPALPLVPVGTTPVRLHTKELPASRVTVTCVVLSLITVLPFTSVTSTCKFDMETVSEAMGLMVNVAIVFTALPGPVLLTTTLQPCRFAADADSWIEPGMVVVAMDTMTEPADGVCSPVGVIGATLGVTLAMLICGALAFATVLPLASLSEIVATDVPPVRPPLATM